MIIIPPNEIFNRGKELLQQNKLSAALELFLAYAHPDSEYFLATVYFQIAKKLTETDISDSDLPAQKFFELAYKHNKNAIELFIQTKIDITNFNTVDEVYDLFNRQLEYFLSAQGEITADDYSCIIKYFDISIEIFGRVKANLTSLKEHKAKTLLLSLEDNKCPFDHHEMCQWIISNSTNVKHTNRARFLLGEKLFSEGRFDEAKSYFEISLQTEHDCEIISKLKLNKVKCIFALANNKQTYENSAAEFSKFFEESKMNELVICQRIAELFSLLDYKDSSWKYDAENFEQFCDKLNQVFILIDTQNGNHKAHQQFHNTLLEKSVLEKILSASGLFLSSISLKQASKDESKKNLFITSLFDKPLLQQVKQQISKAIKFLQTEEARHSENCTTLSTAFSAIEQLQSNAMFFDLQPKQTTDFKNQSNATLIDVKNNLVFATLRRIFYQAMLAYIEHDFDTILNIYLEFKIFLSNPLYNESVPNCPKDKLGLLKLYNSIDNQTWFIAISETVKSGFPVEHQVFSDIFKAAYFQKIAQIFYDGQLIDLANDFITKSITLFTAMSIDKMKPIEQNKLAISHQFLAYKLQVEIVAFKLDEFIKHPPVRQKPGEEADKLSRLKYEKHLNELYQQHIESIEGLIQFIASYENNIDNKLFKPNILEFKSALFNQRAKSYFALNKFRHASCDYRLTGNNELELTSTLENARQMFAQGQFTDAELLFGNFLRGVQSESPESTESIITSWNQKRTPKLLFNVRKNFLLAIKLEIAWTKLQLVLAKYKIHENRDAALKCTDTIELCNEVLKGDKSLYGAKVCWSLAHLVRLTPALNTNPDIKSVQGQIEPVLVMLHSARIAAFSSQPRFTNNQHRKLFLLQFQLILSYLDSKYYSQLNELQKIQSSNPNIDIKDILRLRINIFALYVYKHYLASQFCYFLGEYTQSKFIATCLQTYIKEDRSSYYAIIKTELDLLLKNDQPNHTALKNDFDALKPFGSTSGWLWIKKIEKLEKTNIEMDYIVFCLRNFSLPKESIDKINFNSSIKSEPESCVQIMAITTPANSSLPPEGNQDEQKVTTVIQPSIVESDEHQNIAKVATHEKPTPIPVEHSQDIDFPPPIGDFQDFLDDQQEELNKKKEVTKASKTIVKKESAPDKHLDAMALLKNSFFDSNRRYEDIDDEAERQEKINAASIDDEW